MDDSGVGQTTSMDAHISDARLPLVAQLARAPDRFCRAYVDGFALTRSEAQINPPPRCGRVAHNHPIIRSISVLLDLSLNPVSMISGQ
jgi:hypothetical protein